MRQLVPAVEQDGHRPVVVDPHQHVGAEHTLLRRHAQFGQVIQLGIRNVVEGSRSAKLPGRVRQPDTGVDLVKQLIVAFGWSRLC